MPHRLLRIGYLALLGSLAVSLRADAPLWSVKPLAQEGVVVARSPNPETIFLGTPSILVLSGNRLVASFDHFGAGVGQLPGSIGRRPHFPPDYNRLQTAVSTSDDGGKSWTRRAALPFTHARLFADSGRVYLLGNCGRIMIARSADRGETWSELSALTENDQWAMGASNVLVANGHIYAPMMLRTDLGYRGYFVSTLAPVMFKAPLGANLSDASVWSQSQPQTAFRDLVDETKLDYFGIPFFPVPDRNAAQPVPDNPRILANRIGWHEPYVVQITDPNHQFFDPTGRTLHILARGDIHRSNFGMLSKVVENDKGEMRFDLERTPAGTSMVFVPLPGGNIKFHVLQDPKTGLYWLVSNQVTDSLRRPGTMPDSRFGLPLDQRDRLVLHYSKNLVDWVFAGLIAKGATPRESYHYCGMDIDGEDLVILSRTGDANVRQPKAPHRDAHDTNLITFHRLRNFRALVY